MNKYETYKPSGVEWIGEIPSHWDFIKTNIITENLDGKRVPLNSEERGEMEGEYPYWGSNGVVDYVNQFIFNEEIVLVGEDGSPFFDKLKDVSFYVNEPVWVNNHIHILKPKERILPKYLTHSFNCVDYKEYITGSTRDKLTQSDLKRISHCVPPLSEQHQIVQFLDEKTELIDRLISTKERKITLLKEQRISLINQLVTKGLSSNIKMKDSGIEWIGEIPEHWITLGFTKIIKIRHGYQFREYDFTDEGIRIVKITQLDKDGYLNLNSCSFIDDKRLGEFERILIKENDVLMCLTGGTIGKIIKVGKVNEPLVQNYRVGHFSPLNDKIKNDYVFWFMTSSLTTSQMFSEIRETGQPNIGMEDFGKMKVILPPLSEQIEIVKHLELKTKEIDDLVQLEQKKIDILKEFRQSLKSEVVTGKIKVTK
jgi:type I restriction enzyme S subunit